MKSHQVRPQGNRKVGDFVARILCGKREGPDTPMQGEFSEAFDEHIQEALQIEVVERHTPRPRQCRRYSASAPRSTSQGLINPPTGLFKISTWVLHLLARCLSNGVASHMLPSGAPKEAYSQTSRNDGWG